MASETRNPSQRLRERTAPPPEEAAKAAPRNETQHLTVSALQSLVERLEALESRVPTVSQIEFLTTRIEDQRWRLETWRRLSKWGARTIAVLGAIGLMQSISWKPLELFRNLIGK